MNIFKVIKLKIRQWYIRKLFFRIYFGFLKRSNENYPFERAACDLGNIIEFLKQASNSHQISHFEHDKEEGQLE